jgi:hypothetical protein
MKVEDEQSVEDVENKQKQQQQQQRIVQFLSARLNVM